MQRQLSVLGAIAFSFLGACGGGGASGDGFGRTTRDKVTGASVAVTTGSTPPAEPAYRPGHAPAPQGDLPITTPPTAMAITGGSLIVTVTGGGAFTTVYVEVEGSEDHWEIPVPAGSTTADILLTLAQKLPPELVLVFVISDGAGNVSAPSKVKTTIMEVGGGDLQVSVTWDVDNDIDLHVVDPKGFEIYYGDELSPEGGELDLDSNASCDIDSIRNENVAWPTGKAPSGQYTVRVSNYENCQNLAANYVVTIRKRDQPAQTFMGSFPATDPGEGGGSGTGVLVTTFTYP